DFKMRNKISLFQGDITRTVGPRDGDAEKLRNCYRTLLEHVVTSHDQQGQHQTLGNSIWTTSSFPLLCRAAIPSSADYSCVSPAAANYPTTFRYHRSIRTLAICAIAVGLYGFPVEEATHIALGNVRDWLNDHLSLVDRIVFVVFDEEVKVVYEQLFDAYF
ncbi:Hypothetical protein, putative, partial [Bodo saltans]